MPFIIGGVPVNLSWLFPSAFVSLLCIVISAIIWKRRRLPVARTFYWVLLFVFIWSISRFIVMLFDDQETRVLVSKFQYIGMAFLPVAWLVFSLTATGNGHSLGRNRILLLSLLPMLTVLLAWTNEHHQLIWKSLMFSKGRVIAENGLWFAVHIAWSYLLILGATALAAIEYFRHPAYKPELIAIILAPLMTLFANFNNLVKWVDFGTPDTVSIAFSGSLLLFLWVVFKAHYLQLVPMARAMLIENMPDSVVVLNGEYRIVDANPAAMDLFGTYKRDIIGERFSDLLGDAGKTRCLVEGRCTELNIQGKDFQALNASVSVTPSRVDGYLIVFRDITELKSVQNNLEQATQDLQRANTELRELANTDGLTGLPNRRCFFDRFSLELSRMNRTGHRLCVLIVDLDHFKQINDNHGHARGDAVLRRVANIMESSIRKNDILGRLGGEEFGCVLPETDIEDAEIFASRLREAIQNSHGRDEVPVTASMGLTQAIPGMSMDSIIEKADAALYQSKEAGRNCVTVR